MNLLFKIIRRYYSATIIGCILIGIISCRDFEDCRSAYINEVIIEFKGASPLAVDSVTFAKPNNAILYDKDIYNNKKDKFIVNLKDLSQNRLDIPLHPKNNKVIILFHRTAPMQIDNITLCYTNIPLLLSPNCGFVQQYKLENIKTSFSSGSIINAELKQSLDQTYKTNVEIHY